MTFYEQNYMAFYTILLIFYRFNEVIRWEKPIKKRKKCLL